MIVAYYDVLSGGYIIKEYPVKSLSKNLLVDDSGAGDGFVGGFLSQLF